MPQVGYIVRGIPDLLERHRDDLHAEGAQVRVDIGEQLGAELRPLPEVGRRVAVVA